MKFVNKSKLNLLIPVFALAVSGCASKSPASRLNIIQHWHDVCFKEYRGKPSKYDDCLKNHHATNEHYQQALNEFYASNINTTSTTQNHSQYSDARPTGREIIIGSHVAITQKHPQPSNDSPTERETSFRYTAQSQNQQGSQKNTQQQRSSRARNNTDRLDIPTHQHQGMNDTHPKYQSKENSQQTKPRKIIADTIYHDPKDAVCSVTHPIDGLANIAIISKTTNHSLFGELKNIRVHPNGGYGEKLTGYLPKFGHITHIFAQHNQCELMTEKRVRLTNTNELVTVQTPLIYSMEQPNAHEHN